MAAAESVTGSEYIAHHLRHYTSAPQHGLFDISVIHYDTLLFSLLTAALVVIGLRRVARRATAGVPGRLQAFVELLVELVDEQAKAVVSVDRTYAAPLALTVFCWVTLMNAIDLIPVDAIPYAARLLGVEHVRPLVTADLNAPLGMALGVLLLSLYYGIKIKGVGAGGYKTARLRYRKFDYPYMKHVYGDKVPKLPIVDLCEDEILLPVAGVGGELVGVRIVVRRGLEPAPVATSVITEVVLTLLCLVLFAALGLALLVASVPGRTTCGSARPTRRAHREYRRAGSAGPGRATAPHSRPPSPAGCTWAGWLDSSAGRVVVVAGIGNINLPFDLQPRGWVDGAQRDVKLTAADALPE